MAQGLGIMTLHYMPTFITDLDSYDARQYWPAKFPCIVSGAADFQFRYTFTAEQEDVSASNQARWNGEMQDFFSFQHVPLDTTLEIYPNVGAPSYGAYRRSSTSSLRHTLNDLRAPYIATSGSDITAPHTHPEAYNPAFTIPETGSFPYVLYINPPTGSAGIVSENPGASSHKEVYPYFAGHVPTGTTPHEGYWVYGHFGVSGTEGVQSFDMYWLSKKVYFLHAGKLLSSYQQYTDQEKQDYKDQTDPDPVTNPWQLDANWISLMTYSTSFTGPLSTAPGLGVRWFRLAEPFDTYDTWEFRGEYYLDRTTPGIRPGYEKVFERAAVYPLMNVEDWRFGTIVKTDNLLRDEQSPAVPLKERKVDDTRKRLVCEYGI